MISSLFPTLHHSLTPLLHFSYWTHNLDPVIFQIWGPLAVRWYGIAYLLGFLGGYWILHRLAKRGEFAVPAEELSNFIVHIAIFGVFLGGRLGYVFLYAWDTFIHDPPLCVFPRRYDG